MVLFSQTAPTTIATSTTTEQWQCLVETTEDTSVETSDALYSYHPHYIDAVATRMRASDGHFFCHDANFNVTAAISINESAKPVVERYHYSPYGEVTVLHGAVDADGAVTEWTEDTGGSDIDNEFLFTGRRLDPGTGLQYSRYRYYHPQLGRFVNRDPSEYYPGTYNLYEYVDGMPIIAMDPTGLERTYAGWWYDAIIAPLVGGQAARQLPTPFKCKAGCKTVKAPEVRETITGSASEQGVYEQVVYTWVAAPVGDHETPPGTSLTPNIVTGYSTSVSYTIELGFGAGDKKTCTLSGSRTQEWGETMALESASDTFKPSSEDCYLTSNLVQLQMDRVLRWPCWYKGKPHTCGKIKDTVYATISYHVCECCPERK